MAVLRLLFVSLAIFVLQALAISINLNNSGGVIIGQVGTSGLLPSAVSISLTLQAVSNSSFSFELGLVGGTTARTDCPIDVTISQGTVTGAAIASYDASGNIVQDTLETFPTFLNAALPFNFLLTKAGTAWTVTVSQDTSSITWTYPTVASLNHMKSLILNGTVTISSLSVTPSISTSGTSLTTLPVTNFASGNTMLLNFTRSAEFALGGPITSGSTIKNVPIITSVNGAVTFQSYDSNGVNNRMSLVRFPAYQGSLLLNLTHDGTYWYATLGQGATTSPSPTAYWPVFSNIPLSTTFLTFTNTFIGSSTFNAISFL